MCVCDPPPSYACAGVPNEYRSYLSVYVSTRVCVFACARRSFKRIEIYISLYMCVCVIHPPPLLAQESQTNIDPISMYMCVCVCDSPPVVRSRCHIYPDM